MAEPAKGKAKAKKKGKAKKKVKKNVPVGIAHIHATFNNTIVTITDPRGDVVSWSSAGCNGFKGSCKSTPFAAQVAGQEAGRRAKDVGMRSGKRSWRRSRVCSPCSCESGAHGNSNQRRYTDSA